MAPPASLTVPAIWPVLACDWPHAWMPSTNSITSSTHRLDFVDFDISAPSPCLRRKRFKSCANRLVRMFDSKLRTAKLWDQAGLSSAIPLEISGSCSCAPSKEWGEELARHGPSHLSCKATWGNW